MTSGSWAGSIAVRLVVIGPSFAGERCREPPSGLPPGESQGTTLVMTGAGLSLAGRVQTGGVAAGLTIGEFSRITRLSIRTLRRYHEAGLLEPAHVDAQSGYRYYTLDQIPAAQVIHRFRELDMPLREVAKLLAVTDPDARASLIAQHLQRLE